MLKRTLAGRRALAAAAALGVVGLMVITVPSMRASIEADSLSPEMRAALKAPVLEKIKELDQIRDDQGVKKMQGSFFERFREVDGGYEMTFFTREAESEELITRRYTLTLADSGDGTWSISDEKLEETVEDMLYRSIPGDETFHEFDSLVFDREGLRLTGGKGALILDYWNGKPFRMWFDAKNLKYDYDPGVEFGFYQALLKKQVEEHPKDLSFTPEYIYFSCDAGSCQEMLDTVFQGLREGTQDSLDPKLRKDFDEFIEDLEESRRDYPLAGFRPGPEPGRSQWGLGIKREGSKDHWARLSYDSARRNEVEFTVTEIGGREQFGFPVFAYNSRKTLEAAVDPYEIERRPDLIQIPGFGSYIDFFDLKGLTGNVEMAIEDPEMMSCDFRYDLVATRESRVFPFGVAQLRRRPGEKDPPKKPSINVYTMEDGEGNPLTYVRLNAFFGLIVMPEPLQKGQEFTLRVKFDNSKALYKHNQDYSRVSRGGWAPLVRFTDNIDRLDLTISVPERYEILGIDHQVSEEVQEGIRTARYKSNFPLTFPTIIFGNYNSAESGIQAAKADGTPIPVRVHVDKTSMMSFQNISGSGDDRVVSRVKGQEQFGDIANRAQQDFAAGVRDIREGSLQPIADQAVNAINLFREIYGVDYPFEKMDLVADPLGSFYGQAPPSIVYLGFGVFYPKAKVNVGSSGNITDFANTVVAHEVGHQWWGSAVVNSNFGNYWFVESLAEYSSALYSENLARSQAGDKKASERAWKAYMNEVDVWRRFMESWPDMFSSVQHSDTMSPGGDPIGAQRTALIYNKGPYAFHMLRMMFGPEKFFRFLKDMAQELEGKEIVTRDIQRIAERSLCGEDANGNPCAYDLEWFFDQWIRGIGLPEYSFNYETWRAEDKNWVVKGNVKQRIVIGRDKKVIPGAAFRGKTSVTVIGKDKKEYPISIVIDGEETPFIFKVPVEPVEIVLNKNQEMLNAGILENRDF